MKFGRVYRVFLWALALMLGLSGCGGPKRTTREVEDTALGIDVARFQGVVDWQQVADAGVEFAIIRLGYRSSDTGVIVEDSTARYNMQEAAAAGIPVGVYFFSTAITPEEAKEEAQWVADLVAQYPITYPVVYDCEGYDQPDSRQKDLTKTQRTDNALAFLKTIEKLGYEGMFYASKNEMELDEKWEVSRIQRKYKIWVAQYPEAPYPQTPRSSYSGLHQMWQYSREGRLPGIGQNVDLNLSYFRYDGIEPPKDPTPPEKAQPDVEALLNFRTQEDMVTAKEETNLRSHPSQGEESQVIYTLPRGEFVRRLAVSDSGWSKLEYNGQICYAVSSYLTTGEEEPAAPASQESGDSDGDGIQTVFSPVNYLVTAKEVVNLRSIPSVEREDAEILSQLKHGQYVLCVGISDNGWSKLEVEGRTCYAISSYLLEKEPEQTKEADVGMAFEEVSQQVTPTKEVNLRTVPSTTRKDSQVVVKLENGEIITRTGVNKELGWSRVSYRGQTLYCVSNLLEVVE